MLILADEMMAAHSKRPDRNTLFALRRGGFSLLEVAVALAVMSVGLAGLAALLLSAVMGTALSGQQSAAARLADGLATQLGLVAGAVDAALETAGHPSACSASHPCTPSEFANASIHQWQNAVAETLPGGAGWVCRDGSPMDGNTGDPACDGTGQPVIKTYWRPPGGAPDEVERHVRSLEQ